MEILVRILNPALMLGMPLALGVYLVRKYQVEWGLFGAGALVFIGAQVLHIPFNAYLLAPLLEQLDIQQNNGLLLTALLLGLSAGLFEELARYLGFRYWLKAGRSWRQALMVGAGHGGIEAILLGLLVIYALIQALALRGADLNQVLPAGQIALAEAQLQAYWSAPWYAAILGAVERAATICFHLGAAVLVARALTRRNLLWLLLAIGWHTLVDALAVYGIQTWGVYWTEAVIVLVGLLSLGLVWCLRDAPSSPAEPEPLSLPPLEPRPQPVDRAKLDDSRYN
ncbi:MAG: YhfC family intramembrane metalloprotease [Anaerolineales bacterium]|nr:YhfC family intramembrane metalloprotease [Anaerolineales bacterium]